jgi:hypothetical protein
MLEASVDLHTSVEFTNANKKQSRGYIYRDRISLSKDQFIARPKPRQQVDSQTSAHESTASLQYKPHGTVLRPR